MTCKQSHNCCKWLEGDTNETSLFYHMSNSRKCMGVNGEALQLLAVYNKPYFLLQVTRKFVSVLQVTQKPVSVLQTTQKPVSGTPTHVHRVGTCIENKSA